MGSPQIIFHRPSKTIVFYYRGAFQHDDLNLLFKWMTEFGWAPSEMEALTETKYQLHERYPDATFYQEEGGDLVPLDLSLEL